MMGCDADLLLCNEKYKISSCVEVMPPLGDFDVVHNTEGRDTADVYMARIFRVERCDGQVKTIALLDLICSGYEPYAALEEDTLTVILFDTIVRIELVTGWVLQRVECDSFGDLFEIHQIEGGYIIWGEGEILRYDHDLNVVWRFMGRDILVSLKADRHFWFDDRIHCRDFLGWHYVLDFDGKLIDNFREFDME